MEKSISKMEEAVSAPLPTSSSPLSPAAPAQGHSLSQAPPFLQGEALVSGPPPRSPGGAHQLKGSLNGRRQLNNDRGLQDHQKDHGNRVHPQR